MADIVVHCGREWDRDEVANCGVDGINLWTLAAKEPQPPPGEAHFAPVATDLEGRTDASAALIEVVVDGQTLVVRPGESVALGRDDDIDSEPLFRRFGNVSRMHAVLSFDGEHAIITDTQSSNGTFVNDLRLDPGTPYEFRPGQRLRFASNVLVEVRWRA